MHKFHCLPYNTPQQTSDSFRIGSEYDHPLDTSGEYTYICRSEPERQGRFTLQRRIINGVDTKNCPEFVSLSRVQFQLPCLIWHGAIKVPMLYIFDFIWLRGFRSKFLNNYYCSNLTYFVYSSKLQILWKTPEYMLINS